VARSRKPLRHSYDQSEMRALSQFKAALRAREPSFAARGTMTALFSPWTLAAVCVLSILGLWLSPNGALWAACLVALPAAGWLAGGGQANRVLLWVIAVNWLAIVGDVASADLTGGSLSSGWAGPYQVEAIVFSLCAILALSLGMRWGTQLGGRIFRSPVQIGGASLDGNERDISIQRAVVWYFVSLPITSILGSVAASVPVIAQPFYAMTLIKFACVYVVAAKAFQSGRGYGWVVLIAVLEMVVGLTGYFANYKEAIIVMLIALASRPQRMNAGKWLFAAAAVVALIWVSLVWTAVKKDYRAHVAWQPIEQRLDWMAQQFFVNEIDYGSAVVDLSRRIGYTKFLARIMAQEGTVSLPDTFHFYAAAVQHVLSPRILFPDKAALNDSKITTALLGERIDSETSIGVGYVAQAHVDFGFPGLLLPILTIGIMLGAAAKYFMTRSAPLLIREAFATATLFLAFPFASDIDKALGGFITAFIAMALMLKFVYPMVAPGPARMQARRHIGSGGSIGNMPN
jgi:hypothetical protein